MSPSKPKYVTDHRVSTQDQGRSSLGLEAQKATAKQYLAAHGGAELAYFTEIESGKADARPQLEAALLRCRQTRATRAPDANLSRKSVFVGEHSRGLPTPSEERPKQAHRPR
jgi:hypothetical protein